MRYQGSGNLAVNPVPPDIETLQSFKATYEPQQTTWTCLASIFVIEQQYSHSD